MNCKALIAATARADKARDWYNPATCTDATERAIYRDAWTKATVSPKRAFRFAVHTARAEIYGTDSRTTSIYYGSRRILVTATGVLNLSLNLSEYLSVRNTLRRYIGQGRSLDFRRKLVKALAVEAMGDDRK